VAASPAIAEYVRDILSDQGLKLKVKGDFNPCRQPVVHFNELSDDEKAALIAQNPSYGNIVCRCEYVTEGEIVDAIRRPVGATTLDGVKRRTRAGMGRCQGGFCQPKVLSILARELKLPIEDILLENQCSNVVSGILKTQGVKNHES
jgi:glycerol-3-phosphate dehydrogenase